MRAYEIARKLLPLDCADALQDFKPEEVEEIRLRSGRMPSVLVDGLEQSFGQKTIDQEDLRRLLEAATAASLHAAAPSLAEGYLNYRGLRIGVCGTAIIRDRQVCGFHSFSSVAIRIPAEHQGICREVLREISCGGFRSSLILSPPGGGKTTALRALIRGLSEQGLRVGVVDERNELAAKDGAMPQFDLGDHSDVLTGLSKAAGTRMLLRAMNPQVIAMDEIGREEDLAAVEQAAGCGVELLASVHAADRGDLARRAMYRRLLDSGIFRWLVTIRGSGMNRRYTVTKEAQ
jgi:stage III sporulation protein AA